MADVLVVGAGPVGLTLAIELARHGVRCRIVDRLAQPTGYCKAVGVTPRTLEVWEDMGIVRPMIDAGAWLERTRIMVDGQLVKEVPAGLPDLPYGQVLCLPQYVTEQILAEHLTHFGSVPERGVEFRDVQPDEAAVAVHLLHGDGAVEEARFAYLVGCDGAHSTVRRAAGIDFPGEAFPVEFMLGDVAADLDVPHGTLVRGVRIANGEMADFLVAVPLPETNRYRLSMFAPDDLTLPPGTAAGDAHGIQSERATPTIAHLQASVDRMMPGTTLSDLRWSSIFRISMRIADAYRRGRLFIAGDAAHIRPPLGGQGMNTGIQDVYNLAWKLALVVRGAAPESLLDSYEAERRPVGVDVLERTVAQTAAFRAGGTVGNGGDPRMEDSQLTIAYRDSAWVLDELPGEAGPAAGERAPDVVGLRRHGIGVTLRLFDLLQGTEHVALFAAAGEDEARTAAAMASLLRHRFGRQLRCYGIVPPSLDMTDLPLLPLIEDAEGLFAHAWGGRGSAWVVRPDGHVGFRGDQGGGLLRYLDRLLIPA